MTDVKFIGIQEGFGKIPDHPIFIDGQTGTTFAMMPGDLLSGRLAEARARFEGKGEVGK